MWGCSATGGSQMQVASTRPPSLKAIVPMSAEFDAYPFGVLGGVASGAVRSPGSAGANPNAERDKLAAAVDGPDGARLLAEAIAGHKDNVESPGALPYRDSVSSVAGGTPWWVKSSPSTYLKELKASGIGVYAVANWDEASTRHGSFFTFANLGEKQAKLLVGPATHCAWSKVLEDTGFDLVTEELRFYDHWLKGVDNGVMDEPAVTYFTYNAPKESQWRRSARWPVAGERRRSFYLGEGALAETPRKGVGSDSAPVGAAPARQSTSIAAVAGGQVYETAPLTADLEVTGHPVMKLWLETAGGDVDVLAKIDDVAPDGTATSYQMLGQLRASHRATARAPYDHLDLPWRTFRQADARPMPAGQAQELTFDLLPMSYVFKAGHKVRLTLSFSDPERRADAPPVTIHRSSKTASALILPVVG